jgi:hypothetical protein
LVGSVLPLLLFPKIDYFTLLIASKINASLLSGTRRKQAPRQHWWEPEEYTVEELGEDEYADDSDVDCDAC